jgi:hypothetical protein
VMRIVAPQLSVRPRNINRTCRNRWKGWSERPIRLLSRRKNN